VSLLKRSSLGGAGDVERHESAVASVTTGFGAVLSTVDRESRSTVNVRFTEVQTGQRAVVCPGTVEIVVI